MTSKKTEDPEIVKARLVLHEQLKDKRMEISEKLDCAPHSVASKGALMEMAKHKPKNMAEMIQLNCIFFFNFILI